MRHPELRELIIERIKDAWTPEQIAGRLIYEKAPVRVCQETINRFVYSPEGMKEDLWWYLPEHRRKRRSRKGRAPKKPKIHPDLGIANRPEIIEDRVQFGHWESDLMLFRRKFGLANVTSLVERVSRFTVLLANSNRTTGRVMGRLAKVMRTLPQKARKSVTFDRGSEFMDWPHLQAEVGTQTIKILEDAIGTPVFLRHARGVWLTDAGKELFERVSGPIVQLEKSVLDVISLNSDVSGKVTLGVLPTLSEIIPIRVLLKVMEEHPGVHLNIREAYSVDLLQWLQDGSIDLAFLYGPPTQYYLNSIELLYEDIVLLSPPGSLPEFGEEIHIKDISNLPLLMLSRPFGPRIIVDQIARKANVELESKFDVDGFSTVLQMVESGLCHSFMPVSNQARQRATTTHSGSDPNTATWTCICRCDRHYHQGNQRTG